MARKEGSRGDSCGGRSEKEKESQFSRFEREEDLAQLFVARPRIASNVQ